MESHQCHPGLSALTGSYPALEVLWAQWELGWNHANELHPLHGCVFDSVAPIVCLKTTTTVVATVPRDVNTRIFMTV